MIRTIIDKKAQEEMVGFAMIIIIMAVIILILLGISLNKPAVSQGVESYEVDSFIQALLQHTTECSTDEGYSYDDISNMIAECDMGLFCWNESEINEISVCETLNSTIKEILENSWKTGQDRPVKGYGFNITQESLVITSLIAGNMTSNYKGSAQVLPKKGNNYNIEFRVYY